MTSMKSIREKLGLTQAELGLDVGLTQGAIAHYEKGRRKPGLEECRRIVSAFNARGAEVALDEVFPPSVSQSAA